MPLDPERAQRIAERTDLLRAWGKRLLPAIVEADIYSRCTQHDQRIETYHQVPRGLDPKRYVAAVQRWNPLHHGSAPTTLSVPAQPEPAEDLRP